MIQIRVNFNVSPTSFCITPSFFNKLQCSCLIFLREKAIREIKKFEVFFLSFHKYLMFHVWIDTFSFHCRNLKTYIKTFCCFPERCTLEGYEAIMADFRNSEKVKNRRLMSFLLSRGLMAFACVCTTLEWWRKCSRISLWLFFLHAQRTWQ